MSGFEHIKNYFCFEKNLTTKYMLIEIFAEGGQQEELKNFQFECGGISKLSAIFGLLRSVEIPTESKSQYLSKSCCPPKVEVLSETLIEELTPIVVKHVDSDYRDVSKLTAFSAVFALSSFRQNKENRLFFRE